MYFTKHYRFHSSRGRWHQKFRKIEVEIFQNVNNRAADLA